MEAFGLLVTIVLFAGLSWLTLASIVLIDMRFRLKRIEKLLREKNSD